MHMTVQAGSVFWPVVPNVTSPDLQDTQIKHGRDLISAAYIPEIEGIITSDKLQCKRTNKLISKKEIEIEIIPEELMWSNS